MEKFNSLQCNLCYCISVADEEDFLQKEFCMELEIGKVIHYYNHLGVAVLELVEELGR